MESNPITTTLNYLFGWTVLTVALSWLLAVLYPIFAHAIKGNNPERMALFTLLYGLLAPAATVVSLFLLSLPTLAFPFIADHCHDLNCTPHRLHMTTDTLEGIIFVVITVGLLTGVFAMMLMQLFSSQRKLLALSHLSEPTEAAYRVVDIPLHLAWCAGLFKPQVFLSRGLIESLTSEQLSIVLAHEWTHAVRKDNLRKWCLHWATIIWPKPTRKKIRHDFLNQIELACDLIAVRSRVQENDIDFLIDTLNVCSAASEADDPKQHSVTERKVAALRLKEKKFRENKFIFFKTIGITGCLWLMVVVLGLRVGHPLLEWLSK